MLWRLVIFGGVVATALVTVLLVVFLRNSDPPEYSVVNTNVGSIRGRLSSHGDYHEFYGIPYGSVNVSNPFGASTAHPKFNDIFEADNRITSCPQMSNGAPLGNLDCLRLDIYVPTEVKENAMAPVMVWVHGGGFETGSKSVHRPHYLLRYGIILVTLNYRLGPFGFMCLNIPEVPGNQGLKDQVLAFRWIRDNIAAFGGDVSKISAFGVSAGGHSIDFHLLSDTEVLFNNAILQSGSSLASTVFADHDERAPIRIAEELGYSTDSVIEALEYLSSSSTDAVIQAWTSIKFRLKPCTETRFYNVEPFLTRPWVNSDIPKVKNMSLLIGFCEHEQLLVYTDLNDYYNITVVHDRLTDTFDFDEDRLENNEKLVHQFYFGDQEFSEELLFPLTYMDSDFTYIYPIRRSVDKFLRSEAQSVFYYNFAYSGGRNSKVDDNVTIGSATHADETRYLFSDNLLRDEIEPEDQLIVDRLTQMWTNFAKYSDPTPEISDLLPVKWTPTNKESYYYILINDTLTLGTHPGKERMDFWEEFYADNKEFEKGYSENINVV